MKTKNNVFVGFRISIIIMVFIGLWGMVSCSKDTDPAVPKITLTEVGHDNSHLAIRGDDMHLEADIEAEGLIKSIQVELHLEDGGDYEIEHNYTDGKYIGVRNTDFHEHIDIPADAIVGEYHLHFTVTDRKGQQTTATAHVNIE